VKGDGPDGCLLDSDGDSIPDQKDKCPKKPETPNGFQDQDGCPDELPKEVARFSGTIKGIYFAKNSAKIRRRSYRILNRAIAVLKKYPKLRIKVRGHTDNRGKHKHNMRLSSARAQAIKTYLVGKGIAGSRIETEGVGPKEPVASNKRSAGRAKNRRIEFKILR
jgi:outer membrane protein OmpA-like peptidoglycan-associated protein